MTKKPIATTSTFTALRNPDYRRLWVATVLSGTWVAAHDCAATWAMYRLNSSPLFLSLMSTVASLPFFLFTLPAGAWADIVDRRKLLLIMNLWLAAVAGLLAVLSSLRLLNPYLLLACVFLIGIGFAFNAPTWTAVIPELVSDEELPSAATLSGLQLNLAGIFGPALGGMLIPLIGVNRVFALSAACFLVVIFAIFKWKRTEKPPKLPLESFFESFFTAIRYVKYAPGIQVVLARNVLFAFFISLIPALVPVVGLTGLKLNAAGCGLLFSSMGAGSVLGAIFILPLVRAHFSPNALTVIANLVIALVYLLMAVVREQAIFMVVAALAGAGWTLSASELWVAAQRAMPDWARGRMNATVIMVAQGAMALGGVVWGTAAATLGVNPTLVGAAGLLSLSLILVVPLSINFTGALDFEPAPETPFSHRLIHMPQPDDGPVAITYEFQVDPLRGQEFMHLMKYVRLIYLRNGAFSWQLHEDLTHLNTFRIEVMVPSWNQHLLQRERMTKAERKVLDRVEALHVGKEPPEQRMFLCVNRELHRHRRLVTRPSSLPTSPNDLGAQEVQPAG
ncbi:MAG: MFS transporter [Verrucomicrobia bacterium]|nr:MFS transporter [Verrucomicrobiota bacterium]